MKSIIIFSLLLVLIFAISASANINELFGRYTYRSFINDTDPNTPFNNLRFGVGILEIKNINDKGLIIGELFFGPEYRLSIKGKIKSVDPLIIEFRGEGITTSTKGWVYDYEAHFAKTWPKGVQQVPALLVGHSYGQSFWRPGACWFGNFLDCCKTINEYQNHSYLARKSRREWMNVPCTNT